MIQDLEIIAKEIKTRRKNLDLSRRQLSILTKDDKHKKISSSWIAKTEACKMDPGYSKIKRILEALDKEEKKRGAAPSRIAKDIHHKPIIKINKSDSIIKARNIMKKHGYSQLPVYDGEKLIGSISETLLLDLNDKEKEKLKAEDIKLEDSFPIVPESIPTPHIQSLLKGCKAVLTKKNGRITGIITAADFL